MMYHTLSPRVCVILNTEEGKVFSDRFFNALVGRRELNTRVTHIKHPCFASFFFSQVCTNDAIGTNLTLPGRTYPGHGKKYSI